MAIGAAIFIPLLLLYLIHTPLRVRIAHGLFFLGVFLLLSDIIAPMQWGELNGDEKLREPIALTLLQVGLAAALAWLWLKLPPRLVRAFGVPLTVTILVFQLLTLERAAPEAAASPFRISATSPDTSKLPNIYQFVFDAYSSFNFLNNLETTGLRDDLLGFVFFPRTIANYPETDASVPSFITGRLFAGGSFKQFQLDAKSGGLRRTLENAGYRISIYSPDSSRFWMYDGASYVLTGQQLGKRLYGHISARRLAQLTLVRVAPNFLRRETLQASEVLFTRLPEFEQLVARTGGRRKIDYRFYKSLSVPLVKQLIADEKSRPASGQYVFLHVMLPHSPSIWDESCQFTDKSDYGRQSLCAVKLMGEIVAELKRLGRYDNSLLIFQSDHGHRLVTDSHGLATFDMIPPEIERQVLRVNSHYSGKELWGRYHALLAIKRPFAGTEEIQTSQRQTQLLDIPATIYDVLGIKASASDGQSLFSLSDGSAREIHLYTSLHDADENALGRELKELSLAHLGYKPGRGWQIYPEVLATHEGW
jgi:hypothetical protein